MHIRTAESGDVRKLTALYKSVARQGGGIPQREEEVTDEFIERFLNKSISRGIGLVVESPQDPDMLVAEIHAYKPHALILDHLLTDLTIVVHPDFQRQKFGRTSLTIFLEEIALNHPDIGKVELVVSESNHRAIALYQSMGFTIEGRLEMRIKSPEGDYEADIPMGWINPNFDF